MFDTMLRSPIAASIVLTAVLAVACSAGAAATPTPTPVPPTVAPATATATEAPASTPAPTATTTGGGGRYGGGGSGASPTPGAAVAVKVLMSSLGAVLIGPNGHVLYTLGTDGTNKSTCTGGCLDAWPPLLVTAGGSVSAGAGVTGKLSSFKRPDGTTQVTYKGRPLYYFASDGKGTVSGQGLGGFSVAKP